MPKISNKVRAHVRLERTTEKEARRIAKEDYGDETSLSPVVEEALTKFIASRQRGDSLETILSATEGVLYENISRKIESEFSSFRERIGDLVAKGNYESVLATILIEDIYFKGNRGSKERYEEMRKEASRRLRNRLGEAGSASSAGLLEKNQELEKQVKELKQKLKNEEDRNIRISNDYDQARRKVNEAEARNESVINYYKDFLSFLKKQQSKNMIGSGYTIPKSLNELIDDFKNGER